MWTQASDAIVSTRPQHNLHILCNVDGSAKPETLLPFGCRDVNAWALARALLTSTMRFHKRSTTSEGGGVYRLYLETVEDCFDAYCLIEPGDRVRASALRKVVRETATGTSSDKVRTYLTLEVLETAFDPEAGTVRVAGRNVEENPFVKMGAHHTLDLEAHRDLDLDKPKWDSLHMRRLHEAADVSRKAEIAAVVMDTGLANVCLVTDRLTIVRAKVEMTVPKKRAGGGASAGGSSAGAGQHEKGMSRFYEAVLQALVRSVDLPSIKAVILASPGFVKDDFYKWMLEEAGKRADLKAVLEHKNKFLLAHASSGHSRSLQTVFMDPTVAARLADTRAAGEVTALAAFFRMLNTDPEKAFYGYRHTRLASDRGAIDSLLIVDSLFRCMDPVVRRDYVALADDVTAAGGVVNIFSSMHPSGEQLAQISGVACTCRFPLFDADEASAVYAAAATAHGRALSRSSRLAGPDADPGPSLGAAAAVHDESDASSDSDASYKHGR